MNDKILMVDDDKNALRAYQRQLRKSFHIDVACGGAEALAMAAEKGPYALVVSDMQMPGMTGVQLLVTIKQLYPDTVRIMLTGNADLKTAVDAANDGRIFRFLNKPCSKEQLVAALDAGLEQWRSAEAAGANTEARTIAN